MCSLISLIDVILMNTHNNNVQIKKKIILNYRKCKWDVSKGLKEFEIAVVKKPSVFHQCSSH